MRKMIIMSIFIFALIQSTKSIACDDIKSLPTPTPVVTETPLLSTQL